jgi:NTE family protein
MHRFLFLIVIALVLGGCASYGVVENLARPGPEDQASYSLRTFQERRRADENALMLAFSGGGTRAAALSYGVLNALSLRALVFQK